MVESRRFSAPFVAFIAIVSALSAVALRDWLLQPARAEVGSADTTTADYGDTTSDFVIPYDGYLMLDSTPLSGGLTLEFRLYEEDNGTLAASPEWTEQQTVNGYNGRFSVGLGSVERINEDLLDAERLYLEIAIVNADGSTTTLGGAQAIEPVPYAIWSAHAANLNVAGDATVGGAVTAPSITASTGLVSTGTLSVDGSARLGNDASADFHSVYGDVTIEGDVTLGVASTNTTTVSGALQADGNATVGGNLKVDNSSTLTGFVTTGAGLRVGGWFYVDGTDFYFAQSSSRGDGGRAMVHQSNDSLFLNYNGDFSGGLVLDSNTTVDGDLTVNGNNVDADSGVLGLNTATNRPVAIHVHSSSTSMSQINNADSFEYTGNLASTSCGSSTRGAMVVAHVDSQDHDALCYCAYSSSGTGSYRWVCYDP